MRRWKEVEGAGSLGVEHADTLSSSSSSSRGQLRAVEDGDAQL